MSEDIVTRLRFVAQIHEGRVKHECIAEAADEIERLQTTNDAFIRVIENCMNEIERLRQLGDTLAYWVRQGAGKEMFSAVHAWEEARRG